MKLGSSPAAGGPDLEKYRQSPDEQARTADLLRLLPRGRHSVLDVGARDGFFSRLLTQSFAEVVALDLAKPSWEIPGVRAVAGDAAQLGYPDDSFDCVFCAEVLEHIPNVELACRELARVARHEVIVGVPYCQELRSGRSRCRNCSRTSPPWGHVQSFSEERLEQLFAGLTVTERSFVGKTRDATTDLAAWLMDRAGNPWGTYSQQEPCVHCGKPLGAPPELTLRVRLLSKAALALDGLQRGFTSWKPKWMHVKFAKRSGGL